MKPRIEKKLSKRLAAIFKGLPSGQGIWIDSEIERPKNYGWTERPLTPAQIRHNQQIRVAVNHVPSVGGEYCSYVGDCSDHFTLYQWYYDQARCEVFYAPEFDDMNFDDPDAPKSPEEETRIEALWEKARRQWGRLRPAPQLLAHARRLALREHASNRGYRRTGQLPYAETFHFVDHMRAAQ